MAKIFSAPETIKPPVFNYKDRIKSKQDEEAYIQEVKLYCKKHSKTPDNEYVGEGVSFPHADGKACYVVLSMKPVELIHLSIGDAWDSPYADLLTAKKIKEMVDGERMFNKIFSKKS